MTPLRHQRSSYTRDTSLWDKTFLFGDTAAAVKTGTFLHPCAPELTANFSSFTLVKTFEDYDRYLPPRGVKPGHIFDQFMPTADARAKLDEIKGHLVWYPLQFLKDAEMAERGLALNSWTESVYT